MRSTKRYGGVFLVVLTVALILSITKVYGKEKVIQWRMQSIYPDSDTTKICNADPIVNTLNERLAGKLHIKSYSAGQLVPEETMFSALGKGVFEVALTAPSWSIGVLYDGIVAFGLPMGWRGEEEGLDFFYEFGFIDHVRKLFSHYNIYYAAPIPAGPIGFMGNFAFDGPEDFQGKKIWAMGTVAALVKEMGGVPISIPVSEIYTALKLGTIDGAVLGYGELEAMGVKEVVKYYMQPSIIDPMMCCLLINMDAWKSLPKDIQTSIEETLVELQKTKMRDCYHANIGYSIERAQEAGVQEVRYTQENVEFIARAAESVWDGVERRCRDPLTVEMLKDFAASRGN